MATAIIQFRKNGGAVQTGVAEVAAEDEVTLLASSYAGWQSARWEIQTYPPGFAQPTGWSTDPSSGAYYYNASPISGVAPPVVTMPTEAEIDAGQWGKWLFRVIVATASGTITSDPRAGVNIRSPSLGLKGLAFTEEAEFGGSQRAHVGDYQEDQDAIDGAALVSGGFVSALAAATPISVSASTGSVSITWSPSAAVPLGGYKLTGLGTPTTTADAATKGYVDNVALGLDVKASVFAATTANITLSGEQTIDGQSVTAGKRVLVKNQSTGTQNGYYLCAVGSWTRTTDLAAGVSAAGAFCFVEQGSANGDKGFVCTSDDGSDVVGTNDLAFTAFTGAGGGADASAPYFVIGATATNANDVPSENLPSQVLILLEDGAPVKLVHHASGVGGVKEGLRIARTTAAAGGVATGGEGVSVVLQLPNGSGVDTDASSWRTVWSSVPGGGTSKQVWATATAGTLNDRMELSGAGVLSLSAYTTAGLLTNNGSGVVSSVNGAVLSVGALTNVSNAKDITDLGAALAFVCDTEAPIYASTFDASTDTVLAALQVHRGSGGTPAAGIGAALELLVDNDANVAVPAGWIGARLSTATDSAEVAELVLYARTGGSLVLGATLTAAGVWTTVGAMRTDAGFDRSTAGALAIGGSVATRVDLGRSGQTVRVVPLASAGIAHLDSNGDLSSSLLVNADVDAAAAIAGTKVAPNFGSQNVTTTGSITAGSAGFVGPQIDRATSGAFAFGSNITSLTASGPLTLTQTALGTTQTRGLTVANTTVSGTQHSAQIGWTAFHSGGTQLNAGLRLEPQSATRARVVLYYGTGSGVPSSGGGTYFDSQDSNFGEALITNSLAAGTSSGNGGGFRFMHADNRGGLDLTSSQHLRLKSYNDKSFILELDGDSGGTGGIERLTITNIGQQTWWMAATAYEQTQWGATADKQYRRSYNARVTTTDGTVTNVTAAGLTPADGSVLAFAARITAYEVATGDRRTWHIRGGAARHGGTTAVDGTNNSSEHTNDGVDTAGWRANVVDVTPALNPQVQGEAGKTIRWGVHITYWVDAT